MTTVRCSNRAIIAPNYTTVHKKSGLPVDYHAVVGGRRLEVGGWRLEVVVLYCKYTGVLCNQVLNHIFASLLGAWYKNTQQDSGFHVSVLSGVEDDACTQLVYLYLAGQRSGNSDLPFIIQYSREAEKSGKWVNSGLNTVTPTSIHTFGLVFRSSIVPLLLR
jgi:hypothetical protein